MYNTCIIHVLYMYNICVLDVSYIFVFVYTHRHIHKSVAQPAGTNTELCKHTCVCVYICTFVIMHVGYGYYTYMIHIEYV